MVIKSACMNRRSSFKTLAAAVAAASSIPAFGAGNAIQLHVDLEVDPAKEKEFLNNFKTSFQPTIRKQPGFVDVKMLKFRQAMAGPGPKNWNYRLLIGFQTEEQRQKWVANDEHQRVWPMLEGALKGAKYQPWLYDIA